MVLDCVVVLDEFFVVAAVAIVINVVLALHFFTVFKQCNCQLSNTVAVVAAAEVIDALVVIVVAFAVVVNDVLIFHFLQLLIRGIFN